MVEDAGVGRRVGARGAADRRLVDVDHLVELLQAPNPLVPARYHPSSMELGMERFREDLLNQTRLAAPRHARDGDEQPEREVHVDSLQVVGSGSLHHHASFRGGPPDERNVDRSATAEVIPRDRVRLGDDGRERPLGDDLAAVLAGAGADVDDVVGRADGVLVVFDDDEGVAEIPEPEERLDEPLVVPLVQPDRRFVEDVEHAHQTRTDLGGQADPLRFATRQGSGASRQGQVVEADVEQKPQAGAYLFHHCLGDGRLAVVECEPLHELLRLPERHVRHLGDPEAVHRHCPGDRVETGSVALVTGDLPHELLVVLPG